MIVKAMDFILQSLHTHVLIMMDEWCTLFVHLKSLRTFAVYDYCYPVRSQILWGDKVGPSMKDDTLLFLRNE